MSEKIKDANDAKKAGKKLPTDGETVPPPPTENEVALKAKVEAVKSLADALDLNRVGKKSEALLARLHRRFTGADKPIPAPWPSLNTAMGGGIWPGLHMITGGTGTGKSQLALQLALHAAHHGTAVLYAALELGDLDLFARLLALESEEAGKAAGVPPVKWSRLYLGKAAAPAGAAEGLAALPFHWCMPRPHGWSYDEITRHAEAMRFLHPDKPLLLVIDFAQILASPPDVRGEDTITRISKAGYAARAVARDLDAAVLLLSAVAREYYGTLDVAEKKPKDKKPSGDKKDAFVFNARSAAALVGLGKGSGDLEFACDSVIALARGERGASMTTPIHLAVAKLRAGVPGWVHLRFDGSRFDEAQAFDDQKDAEVILG